MNKEAPHQVVILIKYEIHERNPDGSCKARPVDRDSKLIHMSGRDFEQTKNKANQFLEELDNVKKQTEESVR